MFFKKEKKVNVPDLWNFMTSLNKAPLLQMHGK